MSEKPRRDRPKPAADDQLWSQVVSQAKPLAKRQAPPPPAAGPKRRADVAIGPGEPLPEAAANPVAGLDRRLATRLKRGELPVEGTLDLHHLTRPQAQQAVIAFLGRAAAAEKRCVLIVTGKGARVGEGVMPERGGGLRAMVPQLLQLPALRAIVAGHAPAQPRHGGGGAYYVLLRRQRG